MGTFKKYIFFVITAVVLLWIPQSSFAISDLTFEERNTDITVQIGEHTLVSPFGYGQPAANYPTFADIDADGDFDLFVGTGDGTIIYYKNEGGPRIPNFVISDRKFLGIDRSQFIMFPTFADTDDDGDLDLYFGEWGNKLSFYKNRGNSLSADFVYAQGAETAVDVKNFASPDLIDIDADGDKDLFVGNFEGKVFFYENTGNPKNAQFILTDSNYNDIDFNEAAVPKFADIDADGDFDMFIGSDNGKVAYFKNKGGNHTPSFELVNDSFLAVEKSYVYPAFVDIDADADLDIFLGNNLGEMHFYRNTGTITDPSYVEVTEEYFHLDVGSHSNISFADLDDDSDLDLFMLNGEGGFHFFENTNTTVSPRFELKNTNFLEVEKGSSVFKFVDIDSDNDLDLVMGYMGMLGGERGGKVDLYKNIGSTRTPKFLLVEDFFGNIDLGSSSAPELYDYDKDDDLDLFVGSENGMIYYYKNSGDKKVPKFEFESNQFENINVEAFARPVFTDLDNDGDADLLVGNKHGRVYFIENVKGNVGKNFLKIGELTDDLGTYTSIFPLDSNNDGKMDFFVGSTNGNIHHFVQTSKNLFSPENVTKLDAKVTDQGVMTISWKPSLNSENDLKEYRLYQKTGNEQFSGSTNVGKQTSVIIVQPNRYLTYGFKVTAVDESGLQNDGIEISVKFKSQDSYEDYTVTKMEKQVEIVSDAQSEFCAGFPDVVRKEVGVTMCDAVDFVKSAGIFTGTLEGKLELDRPINRGEVTKVLVEAFDLALETPIENQFLDVKTSDWFSTYVQTAKANNIVEGYADGTFKPGQTINKVELLKVVLEMADTDFSTVDIGSSLFSDIEANAENEWFLKYTNYAHNKGLVDTVGNVLEPEAPMSRKDVIQLLYRMKQKELAFQDN